MHGAYHGAWCWDLIVPELVDRGHTVVTVDLPITDPTAGTEAYADVVIEEIDGMDAPVVVGHSMAGLVIPLVAASRPIELMVFLAAFLPEPGWSLGDQRAREPIDPDSDMTSARFTHLGDGVFEVGKETARRMFFHDVRRDVQDWAIGNLRPQAYRFMDEVTPLQATGGAKRRWSVWVWSLWSSKGATPLSCRAPPSWLPCSTHSFPS